MVVVEAAAVAAAVFGLAGTYGLTSRHVPQLRSRLSALGWKEQKVRPSLPLPTFLPSTLPPSLFLLCRCLPSSPLSRRLSPATLSLIKRHLSVKMSPTKGITRQFSDTPRDRQLYEKFHFDRKNRCRNYLNEKLLCAPTYSLGELRLVWLAQRIASVGQRIGTVEFNS